MGGPWYVMDVYGVGIVRPCLARYGVGRKVSGTPGPCLGVTAGDGVGRRPLLVCG